MEILLCVLLVPVRLYIAKEYIRLQGTNEDNWWSDPWVVFVRDVAVGQ